VLCIVQIKKSLNPIMAVIQKCSDLTTELEVICITSLRLAACVGEVEDSVD
jgi:hypothetical protein